jgi:hypothetical protein
MGQSISKKTPICKALALGLGAGVVVLLLFGLVGKNWLIGSLAGFCCLVGFFSIGFSWFYLKAVERYYKAHPELQTKEEPEKDD